MNKQSLGKRILQFLILSITILSVWCIYTSSEAAAKPSLVSRTGSVVIGGTKEIKLKNVPEGAKVTYKSKDTSVATVSKDGKVTGVAPGNAKIVVKVKKGKTKTKLKYRTTIKAPALSKYYIDLKVSESETLEIKNQPEEAAGVKYTWKSSDTKVAVVKNGTVTGVGQGSAIIEVYMTSGKFSDTLKWSVDVEKTTHTVSFNSKGGSEVEAQEVAEGKTVTMPEEPELEGHRFMGWYSDYRCKKEYDFTKPVTEAHTIYAKWEEVFPETYTICFFIEDGNCVEKQYVNEGECVEKPEDPTLEGYEFVAWYSDSAYRQEYDFSVPVEKDWDLYAKWEEKVEDTESETEEETSKDGNSEEEKESSEDTESEEIIPKIIWLHLDRELAKLEKGQIMNLDTTIEPKNAANHEVIWTSSDESIATVDQDGFVTGVGIGTVEITVTAVADPSVSNYILIEVYDTEDSESRRERQARDFIIDYIGREKIYELPDEADKVKTIHDYLISNARFDYENYQNGTVPETSYEAYGVLMLHTGVSDSYAKAFNMGMYCMGVQCEMVRGTAGGREHVWNIVTIEGERYHVDVTWDDHGYIGGADSGISYDYFMVDDATMRQTHTW